MKRNTLKRMGISVCMGVMAMTMLTACGEENAATGKASTVSDTASTVAEASTTESAEESAAPVAKVNSESDFRVDDEDGKIVIIGYEGESMDVVIPSTIDGKEVVAIGKNAFTNGDITSLVCPDTLKEIREEAFVNCTELTNLQLNEGLELIGKHIIVNTGVEKLVLPESITTISDSALAGAKLTEVNIPLSITELPAGMLAVNDFKTFTVPSHVKTISDQAIEECGEMESLIIEEGVEIIGEKVFNNCDVLKSVVIPASVTEIGYINKRTTDHIEFTVVAGSYAEQYMQEKGYNYVTQ
ncbi:MAG: leucine-rich repeat domain-containing protein [Lachnospiraceae bacterium]|nr:leucine-rich repeat domain-containing protein [Lachnospiraceae bacterium]